MDGDLLGDSLGDVHFAPQAGHAHVGWVWRNSNATHTAEAAGPERSTKRERLRRDPNSYFRMKWRRTSENTHMRGHWYSHVALAAWWRRLHVLHDYNNTPKTITELILIMRLITIRQKRSVLLPVSSDSCFIWLALLYMEASRVCVLPSDTSLYRGTNVKVTSALFSKVCVSIQEH